MTFYRLQIYFLLFSVFMLINTSPVYANAGEEIPGKSNSTVAVIIDENLQDPFKIHWYRITLDDEILIESETGDYVKYESISKSVDAGKHVLAAEGFYTGTGYGIFSYHSDIRYPVETEYSLRSREGKMTTVNVTYNDRGGFLSDLGKRPYISFDVEEADLPIEDEAVPEDLETEEELVEEMEAEVIPPPVFIEEKVAPSVIGATLVTHLHIERGDNWTKVIIRGDGLFEKFEDIYLENPSRIVVDLQGIRRYIASPVLKANNAQLKKIELMRSSPQSTRVICYLAEESSDNYKLEKSGNTLVLTVFNQ